MSQYPKPAMHLKYLDSMRGIAAMMVVIYHFVNWKYEHRLPAQIVSTFINGSDAVSFFFVLSGFVLSYQYIVFDRPLDIKKFYFKRLLRLWPAFFVTIVLNTLIFFKHELSLHKLYEIFILNESYFWNEAILFRVRPQYYVPGWTLGIELAASFLVPFMIIVCYKNVRLLVWMLLSTLLIGYSLGLHYMYTFHFCSGVLIAGLFKYISSDDFRASKWYQHRRLFLLLAILLFCVRGIYNIIPLGFGKAYDHIWAMYLGISFHYYSAITAFIIIIYAICSKKLQSALENRVLLFLGKISYGLYLMHWTFLNDIFNRWEDIMRQFPNRLSGFIVVFILYIVATIVLAVVVHYTIELPFIRIAKRVAGKMKPSVLITR